MEGRGFCVKIELDLQAVTCPGVWLCPNGKIALRINTLNSKVESHRLAPAFPLVYHEKFKFKKLFTGVSTLAELQNSLEEEFLYTELVQWSSPKGKTIVLATFETNLADLLYPPACSKGLLAGSEVDLLMEPTKYFPGILAPKIEVSTRTTIEEVTAIIDSVPGAIINPKTINSKSGTCVHRKRLSKGIIRQRKVCHTQEKSKCHGNLGSRQRQASTDESSSSQSSASNNCSQTQFEQCYHKPKGTCSSARNSSSRTREISPLRKGHQHMFDNCPVCSKYKCYFSDNHEERARSSYSMDEKNSVNLHKACDSSKCSKNFFVEDDDRWRPKSAPHENPGQNSSTSSILKSKTREWQSYNAKPNHVVGDTRNVDYFECERDKGRHGFYKNLEKFYKRMYKQAKIRAQEVDCS